MILTKKRNFEAFIFVVPALLILGTFVYFPLIKNIIYSFQSFTLSSTTREWVGLANYKQLFSDKIILACLKNNILYAVISIIVQVGFGLVLLFWRIRYFKKLHHFLEVFILFRRLFP